jgi:hypothetical protein
MSRLTNKHKQAKSSDFDCVKHPSSFIKKASNRMLRRESINDELVKSYSKIDGRGNRKKSGFCPICMNSLEKNSKGTRYRRECSECKGRYDKELRCGRCATNRVWSGPNGAYCKGCGNKHEI